MTAREACTLLVDTVWALRAANAERDSWRLVALATMRYASDLRQELAMVDAREYVHRVRTEDRLDTFLDQADLRREDAA
jgi:hypothetical protein